MARRILGALLIIRALAPLILLVVLTTVSLITVRRISRAAGQYRDRIGAEVDAAKETFAKANDGLTALGSYFRSVKSAVDDIATDVARLASTISVPLPNPLPPVPPIRIPGVTQFKGVVKDVAAAGRAVGNEVDKVTALKVVPAQLGQVNSATREFAGEIGSAVVRWIALVLGVLAVAVGVWLLGSIARIVGEVRRGWALVHGASPPPLALADIRRQLEELQHQLAASQADRVDG